MTTHSCHRAAVLAATIWLAGCTTFSTDGGFSTVAVVAKEKLAKDLTWARNDADRSTIASRVAVLLASPLSVDDAVQLALLNNPGLQADFAALGIAEADMVSASRLANPGFSLLRTRRGDEIEVERGIHFNLMRLLTLPLAVKMESQRFEQAKGAAVNAAIVLANDTRKAYYQALAAEETLRYTRQVRDVAEASAELARRMAAVGNWSRLQQSREQGFYADAALNVARAEQARVRAREALTRHLGLWGGQLQYTLPPRLPDLPKDVNEQPDIEKRAMLSRLDVAAAKQSALALADNLGLSQATRFINVLELGGIRDSSNQQPTRKGYEISLELPLFDWGTARVAKAESLYLQALNRTAETAINARSEVRERYQSYRISYDIAQHYRDEIVPIRKRVADENLLRYNGMLIGVFDLLSDARAQIASVNGSIEALRDFWLAESDLQMAMLGRPSATSVGTDMMMANDAKAGH